MLSTEAQLASDGENTMRWFISSAAAATALTAWGIGTAFAADVPSPQVQSPPPYQEGYAGPPAGYPPPYAYAPPVVVVPGVPYAGYYGAYGPLYRGYGPYAGRYYGGWRGGYGGWRGGYRR